jgi:hypothetical protein
MPLALSKPTPSPAGNPPFAPGRKLGLVEIAQLWQLLDENPQCPSRVVLDKMAQRQIGASVSVRHLNRLRLKWNCNRPKGRPRRPVPSAPDRDSAALIRLTPHMAAVGVHLLARWLDQQDSWRPLVAAVQQAIEAYQRCHRDADFALLHHREVTVQRRLAALVLAPLLGIAHLSEFDTHEHPLGTVIGRSYQSSTLTQFLGHLERIEAAETLMPLLLPSNTAEITYVDGHMTPYWSRLSMHKGKITMLGRIMAGSQALIAHNEAGQALWVAYYPPDQHLSQMIVAYCQQVVMVTGSDLFVIDRAVNSVAIAQAFTQQGWGLLCMLDDNEHDGLASFAATPVGQLEDGTRLYAGPWRMRRSDDPRHFVMVVPQQGKTLVYWRTPRFRDQVAPIAWPQVYGARNEIQENSFKRMMDHGALNTNYGRKTILGPDRHQQRARSRLEQALEGAHRRLEHQVESLREQQEKVAESEQRGHGKRLEQRQQALARRQDEVQAAQDQCASLGEQVVALGPPTERRDRDFGKQTIMTFRTLWLENALMAFLAILCGHLDRTVNSACLFTLLFERSGTRLETASQVTYGINGAGLSASSQRLMMDVIDGLNAMGLREQGKPIRVCLKDRPP